MIQENKKRVTKVKLEEIPRINTLGRMFLAGSLMDGNCYKEKNKDSRYFTEEELLKIEQKYETKGILLKEVYEELKKKKWRINPNTIKHYIKVGQLPRSNETKKGIPAYYPCNFIRHLNIVRYLIENGREELKEVLSILKKCGTADREILQQYDPHNWNMDFIQTFYSGISTRLLDGISSGEEAVKKAFANDKKKMDKYMKRLKKIKDLVTRLENEVGDLEEECEIRRPSDEDQ